MTEAVNEIIAYMRNCGGDYRQWYAGITANPQKRLFDEHGVIKERDAYIARDCGSADGARSIEAYLLDQGCKGDTGGGDWTARHIYTYKIAPHTRE